MATNKRDVNLIIRAKNQASQAFEQVQKSLESLEKSQGSLNQESGRTKSNLDELVKAVSFIGSAYEKMGSNVDRSVEAYSRQEKALEELKATYSSVIQQQEIAKQAQEHFKDFTGPVTKETAQTVKLVTKAYEDLSKESDRLAKRVEDGTKATEQAFYALQDLVGNTEKTAEALDKARAAQDEMTKSADLAAKKQAELAAQQEKVAVASERRAKLEVKRDVSEGVDAAKQSWQEAEEAVKSLAKSISESGEATQGQIKELERAKAVAGENKKAFQELRVESELYSRLLSDQGASSEQYAQANKRIEGSLKSAQQAQEKVKQTLVSTVPAEKQLTEAVKESANAESRRTALVAKRDLTSGMAEAKKAWQESENAVRSLADSMKGTDTATSDHLAQFAKARASAAANKKAYQDLRIESEKLTRSIKDQGATNDSLSASTQKANQALQAAKKMQVEVDRAVTERTKSELELSSAVNKAIDLETRRSALSTKRDMVQSQQAAKQAWNEAQEAVKQMALELRASGQATDAQNAQFEKLRKTAAQAKNDYMSLQTGIELYTRTLRNEKTTQEQLIASQNKAKGVLSSLGAETKKAAEANRRAGTEMRRYSKDADAASAATVRLTDSMAGLFANSRRALSMYQRIRGQVLSVTASYIGLHAAIHGVGKVIRASMDMQAVESRLNVVTGGNLEATKHELAWIEAESRRLGFSMKSLGDEWSKFAVSAQASNFTIDETRKIFTSVAEAGRVLKMDSIQVERSFVALTQMMSKGTIQMEELRQQLGDHLPGAFALMAQAAGVSGAELMKMMEAGQLTSDYLLDFADVLNQRFGSQLSKSLRTTQAELGRFETAVFMALNKIADAGVIDAFTDALRELTEMLESPDADVWFERVGAGVAALIDLLVVLAKNMDIIISLMGALVAFKVVVGIQKVIKVLLLARTAFLATSASIKAVGGALAVTTGRSAALAAGLRILGLAFVGLGGPIGVVVGLLTAVGLLIASRVSDNRKAAAEARKTIDDVSNSYRDSLGDVEKWDKAVSKLDTKKMQKELQALRDEHEKLLKSLSTPFSRSWIERMGDADLKKVAQEINQITAEVKAGDRPVKDLVEKLVEIGTAEPEIERITRSLLKNAEAALKSETDVSKYEATLRVVGRTAKDTDYALLGLPSTIDGISDAADAGTRSLMRYTQAMAGLANMIPEMKLMADHESQMSTINTIYRDAVKYAEGDEEALAAAVEARRKAEQQAVADHNSKMANMIVSSKNAVGEIEIAFSKLSPDIGPFKDGQPLISPAQTKEIERLADASARLGTISPRYRSLPTEVKADLMVAWEMSGDPVKELAGVMQAVEKGTIEQISKSLGAIGDGMFAEQAESIAKYKGDFSDFQLQISESRKNTGSKGRKSGKSDAEREAEEVAKTIRSYQDKMAVIGMSDLQAEVYNATIAKGISLETQNGKAIQSVIEEYWEMGRAARDAEDAQERVNILMEMRRELQNQISLASERGNYEMAFALEENLESVNEQLREAVDNAIAFVEALGGEGMDLALLKLNGVGESIKDVEIQLISAEEVNKMFASGATQAFSAMTEAAYDWATGVSSGKDAIIDIWNAFAKFAADFLRQIAEMIIQQLILNAISTAMGMPGGGGGGIGGFVSGLFGKAHGGGVVGALGSSASVSSLVFSGASRYHTGGIAGLKPNEVPTILEKGEEVLTRDDPRHLFQGGKGGGETNFRVIAVDDERSALDEALRTPEGERAIITFMKRNSKSVRQIIGN